MPRSKGRTGRPWRRVRARVLAASTVCWLCGQDGADTVDHVKALANGGAPLDMDNLRPAHRSCNSSKGSGDKRQPVPTSGAW